MFRRQAPLNRGGQKLNDFLFEAQELCSLDVEKQYNEIRVRNYNIAEAALREQAAQLAVAALDGKKVSLLDTSCDNVIPAYDGPQGILLPGVVLVTQQHGAAMHHSTNTFACRALLNPTQKPTDDDSYSVHSLLALPMEAAVEHCHAGRLIVTTTAGSLVSLPRLWAAATDCSNAVQTVDGKKMRITGLKAPSLNELLIYMHLARGGHKMRRMHRPLVFADLRAYWHTPSGPPSRCIRLPDSRDGVLRWDGGACLSGDVRGQAEGDDLWEISRDDGWLPLRVRSPASSLTELLATAGQKSVVVVVGGAGRRTASALEFTLVQGPLPKAAHASKRKTCDSDEDGLGFCDDDDN